MGYSPWGHKESDMTEHSCCYAMWVEINSEKTVEETFDQKDEADARKKRFWAKSFIRR